MPRLVNQLAERHVVLFVVASIVFWTLLSPLALVWLALHLVDRYRAVDHSPEAKLDRRVARLTRCYPPEWRERYGAEMTTLLHDTIADGRHGPRLGLNLAREGLAARLAPHARRGLLAGACLGLCWLPLIPQGLVPAAFKTFGVPTRSWFLALYLPDAVQWPAIAGMVALGLAMLAVGIGLTRRRALALPE